MLRVLRGFALSGGRRLAGGCMVAAALLVAGCPSMGDKGRAVDDINKAFRADYEAILEKCGSRVYDVSRTEGYDAVRVTLARLGMTVEAQDPALGYVNVYAPAPRPLDQQEWDQAAAADLPRTREIIGPHVGLFSHFFRFEPQGLEVVISGTALGTADGTTISFTARLREVKPPETGFPRREYLPPTAVRMGLNKIWRELEREFKATRRKPGSPPVGARRYNSC